MVSGATGCVHKTTDDGVTKLAEVLKMRMTDPASEDFRTPGDYHHWAEQWATDSLHVAAARVFPSELAEGCVITDHKLPHPPRHVQSRIVTPATKKQYMQDHKADAEVQLTKAAVRLSDLLNHIHWKP